MTLGIKAIPVPSSEFSCDKYIISGTHTMANLGINPSSSQLAPNQGYETSTIPSHYRTWVNNKGFLSEGQGLNLRSVTVQFYGPKARPIVVREYRLPNMKCLLARLRAQLPFCLQTGLRELNAKS